MLVQGLTMSNNKQDGCFLRWRQRKPSKIIFKHMLQVFLKDILHGNCIIVLYFPPSFKFIHKLLIPFGCFIIQNQTYTNYNTCIIFSTYIVEQYKTFYANDICKAKPDVCAWLKERFSNNTKWIEGKR